MSDIQNLKQFNNILDIYKYANERNLGLEVKDFKRNMAYEICHGDRSKFFVTNAWMELVRFVANNIDETVYIIYSEHHHPFVYMESDLTAEPKKVPKEFRKK